MDDTVDDIMSTSLEAAPAPEPDDHAFASEKITANGTTTPDALPMANEGKVHHGDNADLEEELFGGDDEDDDVVNEQAVLEEVAEPQSDAAYDAARAAAADAVAKEGPVQQEEEQKPARPLDEYGQEITEEEWAKRKKLEYDEAEADGGNYIEHEHVVAEVTLANIPAPQPTDGKVWDLRVPHFLQISHDPYTEEIIEDEQLINGRLGVQDEGIARWRWVAQDDGTSVRQSNARVVCWSDGSRSLQIGSELFDMVHNVDHSAARSQPAPSSSSIKPDPSQPAATTQHAASLSAAPANFQTEAHPLTYLFAQHDYARLLEAQSAIWGTISLRPSGTSSLAHRSIASRAAGRVPILPPSSAGPGVVSPVKGPRKTMQIAIMKDPEMEKAAREAEELKKAKEAKKAAAAERRKAAGGRTAGGRNIRRQKFNARLFSDEEDMGFGGEGKWGDEGDDDEEGLGGARRSAAGARRNPRRGTGGIYGEREDDDGFVVPDEGSSAGEGDGSSDAGGADKPSSRAKRASRPAAGGEEGERPLEDLEVAERELEERMRSKKRRKGDKEDGEGGEEAMDVSEDEKAAEPETAGGGGGGGRRRMVIESDEED